MPPASDSDRLSGSDYEEVEEEVEVGQPMQKKMLFRDDDDFPIGFFFHKSIKNANQIQKLKDNIEKYGGRIVDNHYDADTVLIHSSYDKAGVLQSSYDAHADVRYHKVYVEYTAFIHRCIADNRFAHPEPSFRGMGGRPGRGRTNFTPMDDYRLCRYLARRMPVKASGGRLGLGVYKTLFATADVSPDYAWAARHPPESWKERYKKNAAEFDLKIAEIAKKEPPLPKQLWPENRLASRANKKKIVLELDSDGEEMESRQTQSEEEDDEEENEDDDDEEEEEEAGYMQSSRKRRRSERTSQQTEPVAKRARVSKHRRHQERPQISSSLNKQRTKEPQEEEDEPEEEHNGTMDLDWDAFNTTPNEPGPSGYSHSPERTLVPSVPTHRTKPTTPGVSQQTSFNASPSGHFSNAISNPSHSANKTTDNVRLSQRSSQRAAPSSPILHRQHRTSQNFISPSGPAQSSPPHTRNQLQGSANLTQSVPPPPVANSLYQRPMKAARRPPVVTAQPVSEDAAPYRNTRSRSRSVEPSVLPSATRPKKQKKQKETIPEEPEIVEATDAEGPGLYTPVVEPMSPIGETVVEEMVVENLLTSAEGFDRSARKNSRQMSIETDDAQTANNLRARLISSKVGPAKGFSSRRVPPSEMLNKFGDDDSFGSLYSNPLNTRLLNRPSSVVRSELNWERQIGPPKSQLKSVPFNFKTPDPYTPVQRSRMGSNSSSESFPAAGTHASALKKSLKHIVKHTPYQPPEGTRAAQFAISR